jgi:urease accessory protein
MRHSDHHGIAWVTSSQQLFDSALPTGAYAHSTGLEGLVQSGEISSPEEMMDFLRHEIRDGMVNSDLPVFREAHRAAMERAYPKIAELDELAHALRPTFELRKGGAQIGRQTWRLYGRLFPVSSEEMTVYSQCSEYLVHFQAVAVNGLLAAIMGIPLPVSLLAYVQQGLSNNVQACIKLLSFGPSQVQEILYSMGNEVPEWIEESMGVELEDTGAISPRWDIASSRHQYAERRLYIS